MKPSTTNPEWLAAMHRIDQTDAWEARELIAKIPAALTDSYPNNPEAACRKALKLTRCIRRRWNRRLAVIDRLLGNHGIETVRFKDGSHAFDYSNTGDSYAPTVVLFASGAFRVSSWGDIVERAGHRYA